jgi:hypothetical protein
VSGGSCVAVVLLLAACGNHADDATPAPAAAPPLKNSCANNTRADPFAAGLAKPGSGGHFQFKLVSATPAPPARGDNTWIVEIDDTAGAPVASAEVVATPFMPDHGHGTPMKVGVTATTTPGQYALAPVNLWMPGYWETSLTATANHVSDTAVFKLCIPN